MLFNDLMYFASQFLILGAGMTCICIVIGHLILSVLNMFSNKEE